jgi:hypothetical protein
MPAGKTAANLRANILIHTLFPKHSPGALSKMAVLVRQ